MGVESARIGITSPWATGARVAGANAGRRGHGRLCRHSSSGASYPGSRRPGTVRFYATSGNTFVSVVEFGRKLDALALREGGNSGDPASPHFFDQAERFANGDLGPVYFDPEDLKGHIERTYKPGK